MEKGKDYQPTTGGKYRREAPPPKPENPNLLKFKLGYEYYTFRIEKLGIVDGWERWKVSAKNDFLLIRNNRPSLQHPDMKYRWRNDGRQCSWAAFMHAVVDTLEAKIRRCGL